MSIYVAATFLILYDKYFLIYQEEPAEDNPFILILLSFRSFQICPYYNKIGGWPFFKIFLQILSDFLGQPNF
jgi:hypothetical protein